MKSVQLFISLNIRTYKNENEEGGYFEKESFDY